MQLNQERCAMTFGGGILYSLEETCSKINGFLIKTSFLGVSTPQSHHSKFNRTQEVALFTQSQ